MSESQQEQLIEAVMFLNMAIEQIFDVARSERRDKNDAIADDLYTGMFATEDTIKSLKAIIDDKEGQKATPASV